MLFVVTTWGRLLAQFEHTLYIFNIYNFIEILSGDEILNMNMHGIGMYVVF